MRNSWILVLGGTLGLAACGQQAEEPTANVQTNAAGPKRPSYCFFKDAETEKWSASRDAQGNVVVKGRAFRSDPRYKAEFGPAEVSGDAATISPTIVENRGYASPDNWRRLAHIIAYLIAPAHVRIEGQMANLTSPPSP